MGLWSSERSKSSSTSEKLLKCYEVTTKLAKYWRAKIITKPMMLSCCFFFFPLIFWKQMWWFLVYKRGYYPNWNVNTGNSIYSFRFFKWGLKIIPILSMYLYCLLKMFHSVPIYKHTHTCCKHVLWAAPAGMSTTIWSSNSSLHICSREQIWVWSQD